MTYRTDNIIIVGGGSAGWMSAATLISTFPNKNITVIESPEVPTVGVGESTLQLIRPWMHLLGIREEDFMKKCDASYKMSIRFKNFYEKGDGGFHYPFGKVHYPPGTEELGMKAWYLKKSFYPETPVMDYYRTFFPQMPLIERRKFSKNIDKNFGDFDPQRDVSFHFDAVKFANWLRDEFCIPKGVQHISDLVDAVNVDDSGIVNLILKNGEVVKGDLYIDCTGFKSLLLGSALQEPFNSYEDKLPNNRAWATKIHYKNKEKELEPFTDCTAIENGWVWNIPCWSRIGTGYVYSDKFISKEDALVQFKDYLKTEKSVDNVDDLEYKDIDMRVGIHERIWVKNVAAIGLSAGFIEPLESNGLYTIHEFLLPLLRFLGKEHVSRFDQDMYNRLTIQTFENLSEFVMLHYALSGRRDTEYWKSISTKCFDEKIHKRISDLSSAGLSEFSDRHLLHKYHNPEHGTHCIATGCNYFAIDSAVIKYQEFFDRVDHKQMIDQYIPIWNQLQSQTDRVARNCPSLYQYLRKEIYDE